MSDPPRPSVEQVFVEAAAAPETERDRLIRARCAGDPALEAEVRSLLSFHRDDTSFLDHAELTPLVSEARLEAEEPTLARGTRVADFTVGAVLGSGGMGVVYVAEQHRPRRTVALKVIRSRRRGMLKRFEHEAELLGRLQHPGIAQVYEAGTADLTGFGGTRSQPYIAMELIDGPPLDEYVRRERLDARHTLELAARICDAIQHAHQRGVVHRDLKPANILVDRGTGQPKILDFGVARAIGADTRETMQTGAGQLIGTLSYMSPEQVQSDPDEVDTRADVYAIGVVLYQLVTGRLPLALENKPLAEAARIIREEEPVRAGTIHRAWRGEIETILAKAMAKDRARRYQSAADLAQDIRRFLSGRPIAAKDDSALYVLRKQLRRHRGLVVAGLAFMGLLFGFAVFAAVQSRRFERLANSEAAAKRSALESLRESRDAQGRADQAAVRLREELATSTVERGRLLARTGNLPAAESLLWPAHLGNPNSRQTHWALWELYAHEPCLATVQAHKGEVAGLALAPDGQCFYSAGADGAVRVWDVRTARSIAEFTGSSGAATDLALSRDGMSLAVACEDGSIVIWDTPARKERTRFKAHAGAARGVSWSPDGRRLVTCGNDRRVRVWDAAKGEPLAEMHPGTRGAAGTVSWSPQGNQIACGTWLADGALQLWDGTDAPPVQLGSHSGGVVSLAWSPDGSTLASGGADRDIRLWDVLHRSLSATLSAPNGFVLSLQFSSDGATLASTGWWHAYLWDLASRTRIRSFSLPINASSSLICPGGLVTGLTDGAIELWDTSPNPGLTVLAGHAGRVAGSLSPNGQLAATGDSAGIVRVWAAKAGTLLAVFQAHAARVKSLRFSPDGRFLATGGEDKAVHLWNLANGQRLAGVDQHLSMTDDSVTFSPDGKLLAVVRTGSSVSLLEVPELTELRRIPPSDGGDVVSGRFTPDSTNLVLVYRGGWIRIWPVSGGEPRLLRVDRGAIPWAIAVSSDGRRLAVGDWSRDVQLWDLSAGEIVNRFRGHGGVVAAVEFDPADPEVVISTAADGLVRLWDARTGATLTTLEAFGGWDALSLSLSRDGRRLLAGSANGTAAIWDLDYFDRHIALNSEYQIQRRIAQGGDGGLQIDAARAWAATMETAASLTPVDAGIGPDAILPWGKKEPTPE